MKKQLLHTILAGLLALLPSLALAQSNERMLIYSKSGEILPYRVEHIDSIKFLTDDVDLTLNPTVTPHADGTTGKMKLKVGDVGGDVSSIKVILPESFMIADMDDMQCLRLFTPEMAARMGVQIFNVEGGKASSRMMSLAVQATSSALSSKSPRASSQAIQRWRFPSQMSRLPATLLR